MAMRESTITGLHATMATNAAAGPMRSASRLSRTARAAWPEGNENGSVLR